MKLKRTASVCAVLLTVAMAAAAQNDANGTSNSQDNPVLKTRPQVPAAQPDTPVYAPSADAIPPNVVPEGKRFIIKLKDTLDTRKLQEGKHFKAELREDLVTPSGLVIPRGRTIKGHIARFERGYMGARMMLAMDEIETRHGWVPLIATVTGVPGDSSIKSTGDEGELTKKGPDKKRMIENAAIGAAVGAVSGSVIGGHKGAAVGAAVGAGLGTGSSLLFKGSDLRLDKGTQLEVRLERDLTVPSH
ncbi:MAG TPA: YMGG-like glycine zipper-containing protein [Candidatus Angelobacter sp.]|nr:YMGG-like glycine zipper-containing protein [Candidatus Angelobacter sp.]